ncbi:MAG: DUF6882 domain-containing protein [Bacteroidota bacterium]
MNFKYISVGSFSKKSSTWMWSWNNATTPMTDKAEMFTVKQFGEKRGYKRLAEGNFESHKDEGWQFTAIAKMVLGGIGGYRVQAGHLTIYMLLLGVVDNETAKRLSEKMIYCDKHGANRHAFVCQHLMNGAEGKGFEEAFPTEKGMELGEEDDFQAWCDQCEEVRVKLDGWNDESMEFANIKLVCEDCYFIIKEKNLIQ